MQPSTSSTENSADQSQPCCSVASVSSGGRGQLQDAGTVRHAAEGEHEEDREDAGVAAEAVPELVVSAVGGEHAESELQGEDDVRG